MDLKLVPSQPETEEDLKHWNVVLRKSNESAWVERASNEDVLAKAIMTDPILTRENGWKYTGA